MVVVDASFKEFWRSINSSIDSLSHNLSYDMVYQVREVLAFYGDFIAKHELPAQGGGQKRLLADEGVFKVMFDEFARIRWLKVDSWESVGGGDEQ